MANDQPFNELGQILANGGEIALGLAISRGWTSGQIALLFRRRFEPITEADRARLTEIANRAVAAAEEINSMGEGESIDPSIIPTNPYLFGDEPEGKRGRMVGRFSPDEGEHWFDVYADLADITDREEMLQAIQELAESNWIKYPEGTARGFGGAPMESLLIEIKVVVKRY